MSKNQADIPPLLTKSKAYEHWLKHLRLWHTHSQLTGPRQAAALILSLEGDAQDATLRVPEEEINKDDGVDKMILKLNELYKTDSILSKFQTLEAFKTFKHTSIMPLEKLINKFDRRLYNVKTFGTTMAEDNIWLQTFESSKFVT